MLCNAQAGVHAQHSTGSATACAPRHAHADARPASVRAGQVLPGAPVGQDPVQPRLGSGLCLCARGAAGQLLRQCGYHSAGGRGRDQGHGGRSARGAPACGARPVCRDLRAAGRPADRPGRGAAPPCRGGRSAAPQRDVLHQQADHPGAGAHAEPGGRRRARMVCGHAASGAAAAAEAPAVGDGPAAGHGGGRCRQARRWRRRRRCVAAVPTGRHRPVLPVAPLRCVRRADRGAAAAVHAMPRRAARLGRRAVFAHRTP
eukprot:366130-Chlamydomonas_euryale.AAC.39